MANEITKVTDQNGVDHPIVDSSAQTAISAIQSGYIQKSATAGLVKNDGTVNTTIEGAVTANTNAIGAIKDGQSIDSFGDVESALEDKVDWESNTRTGVHNLLNITIDTETINDVVFTVNADKSVTVNGTASKIAYKPLNSVHDMPKGLYILTGCPSSGGANTYNLWLRLREKGTSAWNYYNDLGNGVSIDIEDNMEGSFTIEVHESTTVSNVVFKPMLRLASDTDDTFASYAKTNRELTEDVAKLSFYLESSTKTTSSGVDTFTFTDSAIVSTDVIDYDFSANVFGVYPSDVVITTGQALVKFNSIDNVTKCRLYIKNY